MISEKELLRLAKLRVNTKTWVDYYKRSTVGSATSGNYRISYAPSWLNKVNGKLIVLEYALSQDYKTVHINRIEDEDYSQPQGTLVLEDILSDENKLELGLVKPTTSTTTKTTKKPATRKRTTKKKTEENK